MLARAAGHGNVPMVMSGSSLIRMEDVAVINRDAWFQAYLGGRWHTFDARNNIPRIGRVLIGYGRDAADVPISHTFGPNELKGFRVWTDDVSD